MDKDNKNTTDKKSYDKDVFNKEAPVFDDDFGPGRVWKDDGTTAFADMDLTRSPNKQKRTKKNGLDLSKKEYRAVYRAAYLRFLPALICAVCGFTLIMILMYFWLG
jgi:hypothetical protein